MWLYSTFLFLGFLHALRSRLEVKYSFGDMSKDWVSLWPYPGCARFVCLPVLGSGGLYILTLPMLRLLSSKLQGRKKSCKPPKPCHLGIHWIAHFSGFLHHFVFAKLATSSILTVIFNTDSYKWGALVGLTKLEWPQAWINRKWPTNLVIFLDESSYQKIV